MRSSLPTPLGYKETKGKGKRWTGVPVEWTRPSTRQESSTSQRSTLTFSPDPTSAGGSNVSYYIGYHVSSPSAYSRLHRYFALGDSLSRSDVCDRVREVWVSAPGGVLPGGDPVRPSCLVDGGRMTYWNSFSPWNPSESESEDKTLYPYDYRHRSTSTALLICPLPFHYGKYLHRKGRERQNSK